MDHIPITDHVPTSDNSKTINEHCLPQAVDAQAPLPGVENDIQDDLFSSHAYKGSSGYNFNIGFY